jgi:hypothetical protein
MRVIALMFLYFALQGPGSMASSSMDRTCERNSVEAAKTCARLCAISRSYEVKTCIRKDAACMGQCGVVVNGCRGTGDIQDHALGCAEGFEDARVACIENLSDSASGAISSSAAEAFPSCIRVARSDARSCRTAYMRLANPPQCRAAFRTCRRRCGTTPKVLRAIQTCQAAAVGHHQICLTRCGLDLAATRKLCMGARLPCVKQCDEALHDCNVPQPTTQALRACAASLAERDAACEARRARGSCFAKAEETFRNCSGALQDAAARTLAECDLTFDACIASCPES